MCQILFMRLETNHCGDNGRGAPDTSQAGKPSKPSQGLQGCLLPARWSTRLQALQLSLADFGRYLLTSHHLAPPLLAIRSMYVLPGKALLLPCSQSRKALGPVTETLWTSHQSNRSPGRDYDSGLGACCTFLLSPFSRYLSFSYCDVPVRYRNHLIMFLISSKTPLNKTLKSRSGISSFFKRCLMLSASWLPAK